MIRRKSAVPWPPGPTMSVTRARALVRLPPGLAVQNAGASNAMRWSLLTATRSNTSSSSGGGAAEPPPDEEMDRLHQITSVPDAVRDDMIRVLTRRRAMVAEITEVADLLDENDLLGTPCSDLRALLLGELSPRLRVAGGVVVCGEGAEVRCPHRDLERLAGLRGRLREHLARAEAVHGSDPC